MKEKENKPRKTQPSIQLDDLLPVENIKGGNAKRKPVVFGSKVSGDRRQK